MKETLAYGDKAPNLSTLLSIISKDFWALWILPVTMVPLLPRNTPLLAPKKHTCDSSVSTHVRLGVAPPFLVLCWVLTSWGIQKPSLLPSCWITSIVSVISVFTSDSRNRNAFHFILLKCNFTSLTVHPRHFFNAVSPISNSLSLLLKLTLPLHSMLT